MRRIVDESGKPKEFTDLERQAIRLAQGYEQAYFNFYHHPKRILPKNPEKCRYWKALLRTVPKLLARGITDFELFCFMVMEEYHRQGRGPSAFPGVVFSDAGIRLYEAARKRMSLPSSVTVQPTSKGIRKEKIAKEFLESEIARKFIEWRIGGDRCGAESE